MRMDNPTAKKLTTMICSLAAVMVLGACSDDAQEETATNLQAVTIGAPTVDIISRSTGDITASNIQDVKVKVWGQCIGTSLLPDDPYGISNYEGNLIETPFREGDLIAWNGTAWQSAKEYYYPRDTYYFRFNAFAPAEALDPATGITGLSVFCNPQTMSFSGDGGKTATYGITGIPVVQELTAVNKGFDILVPYRFLSAPRPDGSDRSAITFHFMHILSRLTIYTYTSHPADNFTVKLKSIHLYLPDNEQFKAMYNNCHTNAGPLAATTTAAGTTASDTDKWGWAVTSGTSDGFMSVSTLTRLDITVADDLNPTYKEYSVMSNDEGLTLPCYDDASEAQRDNLTPTGNEYLLAPTPTFSANNLTKPLFYHYFMKIKFDVTKKDTDETRSITKLLDLSDYGMDRIVQGTSHKLYINLIRQAWAN